MLLGELKVKCLKQIKQDDNEGVNRLTIEDYKNDRNYSKYLNNLLPAINNAIANLVISDCVPFQSFSFSVSETTTEISKETIKEKAPNLFKIVQILHKERSGNITQVGYTDIAGTLELGMGYENGTIIVLYAPTVKTLEESDPDDLELSTLGINDLCCSYISYQVKAELYEKKEPEEAQKYRVYAKQYLDALKQEITLPVQHKVKQVISLN